jgi:xanthine phosphoribosyltransferase
MEPKMQNKLIVSWADAEAACVKLATILPQDIGYVIAIARGGLFPALMLSQIRGLRVVDTFCAWSYDETKRGKLEVLKLPSLLPLRHGRALIVDDLVDSGETMALARRHFPGSVFAAPYAKPAGKKQLDCYAQIVPQDHWIVCPWEAPGRPV